jgi:hypothetical protein
MKRSHHFVSLIAIVCSFAISSISVAGSHEEKKPAEPKITRSQAQLKVLFKYPGASIEKCQLIKGKDHLNWLVDVQQRGAYNSNQVQVDGVTGEIIP